MRLRYISRVRARFGACNPICYTTPVLYRFIVLGYIRCMDSSDTWAIRVTREVGQQIRSARTRAGLTSEQLAVRCTEIGLPMKQPVVANLEAGRRNTIAVPELLAIAWVLEIPPVTLLAPLTSPTDAVPFPGPSTGAAIDLIEWASGREPIVEGGPITASRSTSWEALRRLREVGAAIDELGHHVESWDLIDRGKPSDVDFVLRRITSQVTTLGDSFDRLRELGVTLDGGDFPLPDLSPVLDHLTPIETEKLQAEDPSLNWREAVRALRDGWARVSGTQ